jgi:RNA polymerase sigma factor (sigma-70 family)
MVLGTARRLLGRDPLAEDTFQVAFTALARRASSVRGESVAGWLHRTAVRAAARLRGKRRAQSDGLDVIPGPESDPCADVAWREVRQVLDAELNALPYRLRVPLVLCYLEALTRDEAAARLGWSLRTLERRLGQARATLQARLRRRGVTAVGVALVATAGGLTLPVPPALAAAAARAIPATGSAFRLIIGASAAALVAAGIAIGIGVRTSTPAADPPTKDPPPAPIAKGPQASDVPDVPLPAGAARRFGSLAWRHPAGVSEAVLSADGKTLVTLGMGVLAVWDVPTGRRTYYLHVPERLNAFEPGNVAIAPDGSWVASVSRSKSTIRVIDLTTGKERMNFKAFEPDPRQNLIDFRSIWVPADGKVILLCDTKTLIAYDSATGKQLRKAPLPGRVVALSPDGKRVATHHQDNPADASICDAETGKEVAKLDGRFADGNDGWSIRASFSADGKRVVTISSFGQQVRLWDASTGKLVGTFERGKSSGRADDPRLASVALSEDGRTLYGGSMDWASGVRRWDIGTGKELEPWTGCKSTVSSLIAARDNVFAFENDGMIHRWDATTGKERPAPAGHSARAMAARSPDGRTVVTADFSGRLNVWDAETGRLTKVVPLARDLSGPPFAFRPDGNLFACALRTGRVALFDPTDWKSLGEVKFSDKESDFISGLAFLPDGSGLIINHGHDQVERWDLDAARPKWTIGDRALALAVAADGKHLAVSTAKGISIRAMADGSELRVIPVRPDPMSNVAFQIRADALTFSPDGSLIAATRWDEGDVYVWDTVTGREVRRLVGHAVPDQTRILETSIAFSADGRWLATGHADRTIRVWELATGKEALRLTGHDATVSGVSFARDGKTLLTSAGVEVLQWDLRAGAGGPAELESLWADLGSEDAAKAYKTAAILSTRGDRAAEFLMSKMPPVPAIDADRMMKLVADLDSGRFATREAATKALAELGPAARPALEAGLAKKPSAEGRSRIEDLLARLQKPLTGEYARPMRAVQALQWSGGDAARSVLKAWASGAAGVRLTEEAKRALLVID